MRRFRNTRYLKLRLSHLVSKIVPPFLRCPEHNKQTTCSPSSPTNSMRPKSTRILQCAEICPMSNYKLIFIVISTCQAYMCYICYLFPERELVGALLICRHLFTLLLSMTLVCVTLPPNMYLHGTGY